MMKKRLFSALLLLAFGFSQAVAEENHPALTGTSPEEGNCDLTISIAGYGELRDAILLVTNKMSPDVGEAAAAWTKSPDASALETTLGEMLGKMLGETVNVKVEVADGQACLAAVRVNPSKSAFRPGWLEPIRFILPADGSTDILRQIDDLILNANVDASTGEVTLEIIVRAAAGSALADDLKNWQKVPTKLAGFYDSDAHFRCHMALALPDSVRKSAEDKPAGEPKGRMPRFNQVMFRQVDAGKYEMAISVSAAGYLMAYTIQDGPALTQALLDDFHDAENTEVLSWEWDVAEAMPGMKIHTFTAAGHFPGDEIGTAAVAVSETNVFFASHYDDNVAVLKEKIPATLEASAPTADFQGYYSAPEGWCEEMFGTVSYSGSFTETGLEMKVFVSPDYLMSWFRGCQQAREYERQRAQIREMRKEVVREAVEETDILVICFLSDCLAMIIPQGTPQEEVDTLVGKINEKLPEMEVHVQVPEGFIISGNEVTLRMPKDTPAEEADALVGMIKERRPEMTVTIQMVDEEK